MIEMAIAATVFVLAAVGLGLGLVLGRGPALTTCAAASRGPDARCADCPLRKLQQSEEQP
jgi:hypothetical protein